MQRVGAVNSNPDYLETITGVIVFGSFLSPSEELGDVDVGIELERKPVSDQTFMHLAEARRKLAQERGRRFRNLTEWVTWPTTGIWLLLKSRARQLSIHDLRELKRLPPFRCKILLGERQTLAKSLVVGQFETGPLPGRAIHRSTTICTDCAWPKQAAFCSPRWWCRRS